MYLKNCSYETIGDKDSQTVCYFFMAERINIEPVEGVRLVMIYPYDWNYCMTPWKYHDKNMGKTGGGEEFLSWFISEIYDEKYQNAVDEAIKQGCKIRYKICMDNVNKDGVLKFDQMLNDGEDIIKAGKAKYNDVVLKENEMYVMLFTSGTTNEPKAVMLSQENICKNVSNYQYNFFILPSDTLLSFYSFLLF